MIQIAEAKPLCAENIGLKDIAWSRRGELISRGELIMYYSVDVPANIYLFKFNKRDTQSRCCSNVFIVNS